MKMLHKIKRLSMLYSLLSIIACQGQPNTKTMTNETTNNPLLCNPETGVCEIPNLQTEETLTLSEQNNTEVVKIIYFTDPICSSCWGIEPQMRKLKLEYNSAIEIEYRMGGLLPDWSYNSGGISKPSDVAHHWDEVSIYYDMPIDGDIWLEDPLDSSYPPSIAFKAASLQDSDKALLFLRELREMVFLKKINIAKWKNIVIAAQKVGLDVKQLKIDFEGKAKILFQDDLKLARQYGVRGFPTLFFINNSGNNEMVYGSQPYTTYEKAITKIHSNISKKAYSKNWEAIFSKFETLTAREFSELTETPRNESEAVLHKLVESGVLKQFFTKNGAIWKITQ